jgi:allantoin racemase
MQNILVLNPNSSAAVTRQMAEGCVEIGRRADRRVIFHTLSGAPEAIESQRDVESVVIPTCDFLLSHPADAYVIGCFSDPGLALCREEIDAPVVGIAEAAYLEAAAASARFGIVSIGERSIARHARAVDALGLSDSLAGDRPLGFGVIDLLDRDRTIARVVEVGRMLRDDEGADALVLGCATMGIFRARVEDELAVPVVDPTQAGIRRASTLLDQASLS